MRNDVCEEKKIAEYLKLAEDYEELLDKSLHHAIYEAKIDNKSLLSYRGNMKTK